MRDLHTLLLETEVREGKMVCGNCGQEYRIKEGIANFLLPSHLGELSPFILVVLVYISGLTYNIVAPYSKRSNRFMHGILAHALQSDRVGTIPRTVGKSACVEKAGGWSIEARLITSKA